jgi:glycosidase
MLKKYFLLHFIALFFSLQINAQSKRTQNTSFNYSQSNIYEVNLRQFSIDGSFKSFEQHLPRLRKMGVDVLWFMPLTPIGIKGRKMNENDLGSYYAVRDYKDINPEFGNMDEFVSLVDKCHKMGFKVIVDWVANHSARDNGWVTRHPDFYVKDSIGNFVSPFDWTDVLKLNYDNMELRDSMTAAMKYWVDRADIDGFRCDVAEEVKPDYWKSCITELRKTKKLFFLAEGNTPLMHEVGFDVTYNWDIMGKLSELYQGKINLNTFIEELDKSINRFSPESYRLFFTTNHDENSWNGTEFEKYGDAYKAFAVLTQTMYKSVPLIYNGQEVPNKKRLKFFVKDPIAWTGFEMESFYEALLKLRHHNKALAANVPYKRIATEQDDQIFAFVRESKGDKVVVVLNLSDKETTYSIDSKILEGSATDIFTGKKIAITVNDDSKSKLSKNIAPWGYWVLDYSK